MRAHNRFNLVGREDLIAETLEISGNKRVFEVGVLTAEDTEKKSTSDIIRLRR